MGRLFIVLAAGLVLAGMGRGQDSSGEELKKLRGAWNPAAMSLDGVPVSEGDLKKFQLQIQDDQYTLSFDGRTSYQAGIKLGKEKNVRSIDTVPTAGPYEGKGMQGIYNLEGDTLKVCFATKFNEARPGGFDSKPGSGYIMAVYKRIKTP